jgi:hypothetical protein
LCAKSGRELQLPAGQSLDVELLPQVEFASVHFAVVFLVIVAAEVKQAVKDQLLDLSFKG